MSIYDLKPRFQNLLRPTVTALHRYGVTANQVTIAACICSVALGAALLQSAAPRIWFAAIPMWMFARMALNAADGMLAREFGHKSSLGAYLNELGDVIADAALYLPFAHIAPFTPGWVGAVIFLAALSEFTGLLGATLGASRRYDGPMGKSDRAFVFGALGLWVAIAPSLPDATVWLMPTLALAIVATIVKRVRGGLAESARRN